MRRFGARFFTGLILLPYALVKRSSSLIDQVHNNKNPAAAGFVM